MDRSCVPKRRTVLKLLNRLLLGTSKFAKEKARVLFLYVVSWFVLGFLFSLENVTVLLSDSNVV